MSATSIVTYSESARCAHLTGGRPDMYRIVAGEMSTQRRQSRRLASAEPEEALPPPVPKHVEAEINVTEAKASQDMPRSTRPRRASSKVATESEIDETPVSSVKPAGTRTRRQGIHVPSAEASPAPSVPSSVVPPSPTPSASIIRTRRTATEVLDPLPPTPARRRAGKRSAPATVDEPVTKARATDGGANAGEATDAPVQPLSEPDPITFTQSQSQEPDPLSQQASQTPFEPAVALVETGDSLLSTAPVVPGSESTSVPVPLSSVVSKPSSVSASQPPATPIVSTLAEDMSPPLIAEVSPTATMREHQLESPAVLPSKPPSLPPTPTAAPAAAPIAAPPVALPVPPAVAPTGSKPSSAPAKVKPVATAPVRVLKGQLSAAMRDLDVMHGVFRGGNSNVAPSFGVFGKRVEPDFDAVKLPSSEAAARDARKHKKKKHKPRTILDAAREQVAKANHFKANVKLLAATSKPSKVADSVLQKLLARR